MDNDQAVRHLAAFYGVETEYHDMHGKPHQAKPEVLLAVLRAMEAPIDGASEALHALRAVKQQRWRQLVEPVTVVREGAVLQILIRLAHATASATARCQWELEGGGKQVCEVDLDEAPVIQTERLEGITYSVRRLRLPWQVPAGYHHLTVDAAGQQVESLVIAAPEMAYQGDADEPQRRWGVFLPLYALRRDAKQSSGNLSDLQDLVDWAAQQGASYVATLPILAGDVSNDPTPYAPNSQYWWNEFYLDPTQIPEFAAVPEARDLLEAEKRRLLPASSAANRVDYVREENAKREILDALASSFFSGSSDRRKVFEHFCVRYPDIASYARFRAIQESLGADWTRWPVHLRDDIGAHGEMNQTTYERHLYAQWNMQLQIERLAAWAGSQGMSWYLDLPLGSSRAGYDVWRHRDLFALAASGGAPPDAFFSAGQNWSFPPLRPDRLRQSHYDYFIKVLRRQMQHAQILRLDHAMRFERLFWIPSGLDAGQGVYVRYPADEFFAILALESHRTRTRLVGENLGTVPKTLNERLRRHGIDGTYVLQFEVRADDKSPITPVPSACAACLNTHDMPPFSAFFAGLDVDDRLDLELLCQDEAVKADGQRRRLRRCLVDYLHGEGWLPEWTLDPELVLEALLSFLAASPAGSVTVNLEDLWLETRPQNTPGTSTERPNWRRQAKYTLEEIAGHPAVRRILGRVDRLRAGGRQ